ncbi:hypothetical protein AYO44_09585 [Planctomycetaceae bacterium SCGC AG-212-F19]|nr:hypothetical protein AYO44_09585 [Planctomycetaceae bacterium SCGC AG-212-F19]
MPTLAHPALRPAQRQSLGQTVADSLRDAIFAGRLQPGQRIGQIPVARDLGVSQTTVREALAILEHEGLVEREANQGAVVRELSRADIEEIVTLRANLEAMAVRRLIGEAKPEHVEALRQNIRAMQTVRGAGDLADLDLDFHELLLRLAGHQRLLACWQSLRTQIKLLMVTHNLRNPRSARSTVANHKELLQLIQAGDSDGAAAHLERGNLVYFLQATTAKERLRGSKPPTT